MKKIYIGVTLMFYIKHDEMYKAIQSSYIIELSNFLNFIEDVNLLTSSLIKTEFLDYQYAGITDLYVTEKEDIGNFLGRSSYFDYKTYADAKKLILGRKEIIKIINTHTISDKFNIGFVYFNEDSEGSEFNSTIIVNSQLNNVKDIEGIESFAISTKFKQKILDFSVEQIGIEDLKFVGISDFYKIKGKGLFSISGTFKNFKSISAELIEKSELEKKFDDVIEDYSYVG
jgi:hypothetical protein